MVDFPASHVELLEMLHLAQDLDLAPLETVVKLTVPQDSAVVKFSRSHFFRVKHGVHIWRFPKIWVPENGWFIVENPTQMDDLGIPLFSETTI